MYTVLLPLILIIVLMIRGLTLPGAIEGLRYYLTPDFGKLRDPRVWIEAYAQIFFSLSVAMAVLICYASHKPQNSDATNNAFIISFANCGTSFLCGLVVFSVLGYLAQATGVSFEEIAGSGIGLAFVTVPAAINKIPFVPAFFGVVFFATLLTLAVDSAFSLVEAGAGALMDKWGFKRGHATLIACAIPFFVGLLFCTRGGLYWLDIVDHWICDYGFVPIAFSEVIIIGYIFGAKKLRSFLNSVSEIKTGLWWDVMIKFIIPVILGALILLYLIEEFKGPYGGYPGWALGLGGWAVVIGIFLFSFVLMKHRGAR
jgi:NSS family neurotransmitter:Na+ symporter